MLVLVLLSILSVGYSEAMKFSNEIVDDEGYPYVVHIRVRKKEISTDNNMRSLCTGIIYTTRTILTAAHCLEGLTTRLLSITVTAGFKNKLIRQPAAQEVHAYGIRIHDGFIPVQAEPRLREERTPNDLAMVWMSTDLIFSPYVSKAPISESKVDMTNKEGTVVGWGRDEYGYETDTLKYTKLTVIKKKACKKAFCEYKISGNVFCAKSIDQMSIPTQGDSGGPFIFEGKVIGLLSFGGCEKQTRSDGRVIDTCIPEYPLVYIKLYKYYNCIEKWLKQGPPKIKCTGTERYCIL